MTRRAWLKPSWARRIAAIDTGTIFVVEDDPDDREFIAAALQACGMGQAAVFFPDGVQALACLHGPSPPPRPPRVAILDLMLPKVSGLEVLERLRADARTAALPVAIFSSSEQPGDIERAYALGANSYVRKPVDPEEFSAAVAELARYWTRRNIPTALPR